MSSALKDRQGWPDHFSLKDDPVFLGHIRPFIDTQMAELAAFDRERAGWTAANLPADYKMTYIFHEHAARVADDMKRTALYLGLPDHAADNLYWAMLPHDIGKKALAADLWDRVDKPDRTVQTLRRSHTELGVSVVRDALPVAHPFIDLMHDIMLNHHEQMDGGGLRGVSGEDLSLPVRLACIVESYDGYATPRPHFGDRDVSPAGVIARMRGEKGGALYDMDLFNAFAEMKLATGKRN